MSKRRYSQKRRAAKQAETRARIVEAIMALHEEVGPRATTVSGIAERAGVERLTVYRHFPDEASMFQACSARFLELNPPPDPPAWREGASPGPYTREMLASLYRYYRSTERMFRQIHRDAAGRPALKAIVDQFESYLDGLREDLASRWAPDDAGCAALRAVIGHALAFSTWASFDAQDLDDPEMADLVARWLEVLTHAQCMNSVHPR